MLVTAVTAFVVVELVVVEGRTTGPGPPMKLRI